MYSIIHSRAGARRSRWALRAIAGASLVALAGAAKAQTPETTPEAAPEVPASGQVYEPGFFERFAPQTAFDMVRNIPGFSLERGEERRGFGQGGDNILINGRRLSGKSNGAFEVLGRIGANSVIRIEIVDGASLRMPGLSGQVANVITKPQGITGRWRYDMELREDARPGLTNGNATVSGENGPVTWTLGVSSGGHNGAGEGPERVTDEAGRLIDFRLEQAEGGGVDPGVNGALTYQGRTGDLLNITVSADFPEFRGREVSKRTGIGQPDRVRIFEDFFQGQNSEVGADYDFAMGPGRLKLIAVASMEEEDYRSEVLQATANAAAPTGSRFLSASEAGESILRGEYSFPPVFGGDWQLAVEGAFNFLEQENRNLTRTAAGDFTPRGSIEATRVEERRAEATFTHTREIGTAWSLQATLGGEYSEISQSGAGGLTREFVRPKGFVSLAWDAAPDLDLNFRVERKVGQLAFDDFAASSDLNNETQRTGNVDLVPEQSWLGEIEVNRRMGAWGALKLKVFGESIEDVVDEIPIFLCGGIPVPAAVNCPPPGTLTRREGVGNIDTARRYGVGLNGTLQLDPMGLKGMKIDLELEVDDSQVTDPVTGRDRRIGGQTLSAFEIDFRHDIPGTDLAWGLGFEDRNRSASYSLTQRSRSTADGFAQAFFEHKDLFGLRARFQVINFLNREEGFARIVYNSGRDGPVSFVEDRVRTSAPTFRVFLSRTF